MFVHAAWTRIILEGLDKAWIGFDEGLLMHPEITAKPALTGVRPIFTRNLVFELSLELSLERSSYIKRF